MRNIGLNHKNIAPEGKKKCTEKNQKCGGKCTKICTFGKFEEICQKNVQKMRNTFLPPTGRRHTLGSGLGLGLARGLGVTGLGLGLRLGLRPGHRGTADLRLGIWAGREEKRTTDAASRKSQVLGQKNEHKSLLSPRIDINSGKGVRSVTHR